MQLRRTSIRLAWLVAVASMGGCEELTPPLQALTADLDLPFRLPWEPAPIALLHDLDGSAALAAAALANQVHDRRFPTQVILDCESHATRFAWLAARAEEAPTIEASLRAMMSCRGQLSEADVLSVAAGQLFRSDDPGVLAAALDLARPYITDLPVDAPVVAAVIDVAIRHRDMGTRIEALEVLDERVWSQERAVSDAFYEALMAEWKPSLTATALRCLTYRGAGLTAEDRGRYVVASMILASDIDPGIRGFSALALARIAPDDEEVRARVLGLLDDPHPYTRSAAAEALADMGYLPAAHELMTRLQDDERNVWRMLPFHRPNGQPDRLRFAGSHFERVDDAMLRALERLTEELEHPFVYREVSLRYKALDIVAATRDAQRWYAEHGDALSRRGVADPEPVGQGSPDPEDR